MARRIATVGGYALRPGVSRNGRLYTRELIAGAVEQAQARLAEGGMNVVDRTTRVLDQRTHHAAEDDSTRIVGRLTRLYLTDDGSARFEADIADTAHGRTIASLIAPKDPDGGPDEVEPFLTGVSIRGAWTGQVRRVQHDGKAAETADGLVLDGLDYTGQPGVDGAVVDDFTPAAARPSGESETGRALIFESVQEAQVTAVIQEAAASTSGNQPYGDVVYADPGYQKDKQKRYPLNTKKRAKAAWSYINQADDARLYTSAQLKRVKARIVKALKGFGVTVATQERWLIEPAQHVTETLAECWDMDRPEGSLYLSLTNGPTTVTISSSLLDAHDLELVGRAAMAGACDALLALDPDMDADIDLPGAEPEDTDDGMGDDENEPGSACDCGCGCAVPHPMAVADGCPCNCGCTVCKATGGDADETAPQTPAETAAEPTTSEETPAMAESTTPAETTPGTPDSGIDALSAKFDKLTDLIGGLVTAMAPKPVEAAPAAPAPVAEQAPAAAPVTESEDERIARLVAEGIAKALPTAVQEHVEQSGGPARKGLTAPVTENATTSSSGMPEGWPNKPLHTYTAEEWRQYVAPNTVGAILGARGALPEDN